MTRTAGSDAPRKLLSLNSLPLITHSHHQFNQALSSTSYLPAVLTSISRSLIISFLIYKGSCLINYKSFINLQMSNQNNNQDHRGGQPNNGEHEEESFNQQAEHSDERDPSLASSYDHGDARRD